MARAEDYHNVTVDNDDFDCALELKVWDSNDMAEKTTIRIAVEDIPDFMAAVARHASYALSVAARRIEVGHCERCANTGLVDVEKNGRMSNEYCPECRHRWPSDPFKNAPHIGYRDA